MHVKPEMSTLFIIQANPGLHRIQNHQSAESLCWRRRFRRRGLRCRRIRRWRLRRRGLRRRRIRRRGRRIRRRWIRSRGRRILPPVGRIILQCRRSPIIRVPGICKRIRKILILCPSRQFGAEDRGRLRGRLGCGWRRWRCRLRGWRRRMWYNSFVSQYTY